MTYTATFTVRRKGQPHVITVNFAGCRDSQHAYAKLYRTYADIIKVKKIVPKEEEK